MVGPIAPEALGAAEKVCRIVTSCWFFAEGGAQTVMASNGGVQEAPQRSRVPARPKVAVVSPNGNDAVDEVRDLVADDPWPYGRSGREHRLT